MTMKKKKKKSLLELPRYFLWSMLTLIKIDVFNPEFSSDFRDAMLTAIINCLTSLLAGFVVFAVLGYMAHIRESTVEALALQGKLGYMSRLMTKPTKWHMLPAKTQISLGMCPVWSESSLSAWRKLVSLATHECTAKTLIRLGGCPGWSLLLVLSWGGPFIMMTKFEGMLDIHGLSLETFCIRENKNNWLIYWLIEWLMALQHYWLRYFRALS